MVIALSVKDLNPKTGVSSDYPEFIETPMNCPNQAKMGLIRNVQQFEASTAWNLLKISPVLK